MVFKTKTTTLFFIVLVSGDIIHKMTTVVERARFHKLCIFLVQFFVNWPLLTSQNLTLLSSDSTDLVEKVYKLTTKNY